MSCEDSAVTSLLATRTRRRLLGAVLAVSCIGAGSAFAADQTSVWNNSTGNWSDATRWSTNPLFPNNGNGGFTYDAVINNGTVTLDQSVTIEALNLTGGTLAGAPATNFTLTLNDLFTWTGGTIGGPGTVNATDGITLSGSAGKAVGNGGNSARTLVNGGVANLSGGNLLISSSGGANPGSAFQNNATFNVTDGADISHNNFGGTAGSFANAGTFNKSGAGSETTISTLLANTGTMNVDSGTLQLSGGGTSSGTMAVDGGATLRFSAGAHTLTSASTTTGAGDVTVSTGTVNVDGAYTVTGATTILNGTVNFNAPSTTLTTLNFSAGTLGGTGSQNIATAFDWTGGTLAGASTLTINNTATLTMSGPQSKTLGNASNTARTLVNNGVANLSQGNLLISSSGGASPGSVFQNNGTFNATDDADITLNNFGGSAGRFANAGTFNKSGAGTTTNISTQFSNTGTVNIDQGTLQISGGGTSTGGTMAVDAGATLLFAGGTFTLDGASAITGTGDVTFSNATVNVDGAYAITGVTTISSGAVNFNAPSTTLTTLNLSGGTLGGTGSQSITSAFNWTGGTLGSAGTTTINNTATLTMSGASAKTVGNGSNTARTLVNNGVANLSQGNLLISSSGGANPGSVFQNNGTFNVADETDIVNNNFGGTQGSFANAGTFNKSGVGTTTDISTRLANTGTVNVDSGTLQLSGGGTSGGAIAVDSGTTLRFSGGTHTLDSASTTTGAGDVIFSNATVNVDGAYTVTGPTTIISGTVNFNAPSTTLGTLNLSGGTLGGTGAQNITTAFNWTGGTLGGAATTTVNPTATFAITGPAGKTLGNAGNTGRTLVNNSVANLSEGNLLISSSGGANPGSVFQNSGMFNATDEVDIVNNNFGGTQGRFANAGTFNKSGAGTTTNISAQLANAGTVNVNEGTLQLGGGGSSTGGTLDVDAAATLQFNGGTFTIDNASTTTGAGDVTFSSGTITVDGAYTVSGITTVGGATANFNTPAATLSTLNVSGGTLGGTGSQNVTSAFNWTGGTLGSTGTTTINNTATLTMSGATGKTLGNASNTGRTLVNNGVANLSGGSLLLSSSGGANPGSVFRNNGTFNATDDADIVNNNFGGTQGSFANAGSFNKSGAGTTTNISAQFHSTGAVNVDAGTLAFSGGGTSTGGIFAVDGGALLEFSGGTFTMDNASKTSGGGTVNVAGSAQLHSGVIQELGTLSIANSGRASIVSDSPTSSVDSLVIAGATNVWTGTLDLRNNDMVVHSTAATKAADYARVANQVKSGLGASSGVFWTGRGIQSSTAAANQGGILTAVGIILNDFAQVPGLPSGPIYTDFGGVAVDENDILTKYTWFGDADLTGVVDATDYSLIDNAFNLGLVNGGWLNGDFDFNGLVDATDYSLIDNAFNSQTGTLGGRGSGLAATAAAVPEPTVMGLLAVGALGLLSRRRKPA